ncbi:MAG: helix-turn-helix domain-containing protein [Mariprofundaceae bacterium]
MKPQIIYDHGHPVFVVIPYREYIKLAGEDEEFVDFRVEDYISNPIKAARIKAGITQQQLADRLDVSQAYIAKIERPGHKPTEKMLARVQAEIANNGQGAA